ncbi:hypothetical protein [Secundilactobacillus silagei]|uniref:hypothetical protein n=1 Tax=Secundilactobacillus silagei TaxID=1293415 RepID=UPI000AABAD5A|nr:hypothetical protein [Secundilactobacillus silagei]
MDELPKDCCSSDQPDIDLAALGLIAADDSAATGQSEDSASWQAILTQLFNGDSGADAV